MHIGRSIQRLSELTILGEICSSLSKKQLGRLSVLNKSFASTALDDIMWKSLDPNSLPLAYQKLPGSLLKQKLKKDHEALKAKVELVLKNESQKIDVFGSDLPLFL